MALAKAKEEILRLEHEEAKARAERDLAESLAEARQTRALASGATAPVAGSSASHAPEEGSNGASAGALVSRVMTDVSVITEVAAKSGKGTFVRALKDAALSIRGAVEELGARTSSEEMWRL